MSRSLAALLGVVFAATVWADDPPKKEPSATVTLKELTVKDGIVVKTELVPVQESVAVPVTRTVNGKAVTSTEVQTLTKLVPQQVQSKLKDLKATGVDGKEIPAEELAKRLKNGGVVVMHAGKLDAEFRKLFKDGTVFIDGGWAEAAPPAVAPPAKPEK